MSEYVLDFEELNRLVAQGSLPPVVSRLVDRAKDFRWQFDQVSNQLRMCRERSEELNSELAGLRTGYDAYEKIVADLRAENEALRKQVEDLSPFKGAPLAGPDLKCLACGGYHYGIQGLPCPNMRNTAQADLPSTRSGQIGAAMSKEPSHG